MLRPAVTLALVALLGPGAAVASGRWYAWLDRISHGQGPAAAAEWSRRGVPARLLPSERVFGVEPGFDYVVAAEGLFKSEAQAFVDRLHGGGFTGAGVQYFSDALPAGATEALGAEPVFAVEVELDAAHPVELVALTRGADGDLLRILRRHADATLTVETTHPARLFDLPRVTEGERVRVFPLGPDAPGQAIVFEAGFTDARQLAHWSVVFAFRGDDVRVAPQTFFVPGARSPLPTTVVFEPTPVGLGYTVTVEGLRGGTRRRTMVWRGERFVDAAAGTP